MGSNKVILGVNDLYTWCKDNGVFGQRVLSEFAGLDVNKSPVSISSFAAGSSKKVYWRCSEGHVWLTSIACRTRSRTSCPKCRGQVATDENNLLQWCISHGDYGERLRKEYTGESATGDKIAITDILPKSIKRMVWICSDCGGRWIARVANRTRDNPTGCFRCGKNRAAKVRREQEVQECGSLLDWCNENGSFGALLLSEWTGKTELDEPIDITKVAPMCNRRVVWRCRCGNTWVTAINARVKTHSVCLNCARVHAGGEHKKPKSERTVAAWCRANPIRGEKLMHEWCGETEAGIRYSASEVMQSSEEKIKWICDKGHEYMMCASARIYGRQDCPYCARRRVLYEDSLLHWCEENKDKGSIVLSEWTGLKANDKVTGRRFDTKDIYFDSTVMFEWQCNKGHRYKAQVRKRVLGNVSCPYCMKAK